MSTTMKEEKKHRHKWTYDYCDCPFCIREHESCECGEIRNANTRKKL